MPGGWIGLESFEAFGAEPAQRLCLDKPNAPSDDSPVSRGEGRLPAAGQMFFGAFDFSSAASLDRTNGRGQWSVVSSQ